MTFMELIKGRRSVRSFDPSRLVDDRILQEILSAGQWAPSAGNVQPWRFFVINNPAVKMQLVEASYGQMFISEAPLVILVCADVERAAQAYGDRGRFLYCLQDTAAAVQNMLLYIHSSGLASCWVGAFDEMKIIQELKLPAGLRPVSILPVGYPAASPKPPARTPMNRVVTTV